MLQTDAACAPEAPIAAHHFGHKLAKLENPIPMIGFLTLNSW